MLNTVFAIILFISAFTIGIISYIWGRKDGSESAYWDGFNDGLITQFARSKHNDSSLYVKSNDCIKESIGKVIYEKKKRRKNG